MFKNYLIHRSDTEALTLGIGRNSGETIRMIEIDGKTGLRIRGYKMRKIDTDFEKSEQKQKNIRESTKTSKDAKINLVLSISRVFVMKSACWRVANTTNGKVFVSGNHFLYRHFVFGQRARFI